jgi:hypothetical protein
MASIVGQIRCTDGGRWPVAREFSRRMKRRFSSAESKSYPQVKPILKQIPAPADVALDLAARRAAG